MTSSPLYRFLSSFLAFTLLLSSTPLPAYAQAHRTAVSAAPVELPSIDAAADVASDAAHNPLVGPLPMADTPLADLNLPQEPTALDAPLSVTHQQSARTAGELVGGTLVVTLTVTNNQPPAAIPPIPANATVTDTIDLMADIDPYDDPNTIHNVLLANELTPDAQLTAASVPADMQGAQLAWNLGSIPPLHSETITVTLTVTPNPGAFTAYDTGATAWGMLTGRSVSAQATPIRLAPDNMSPWLVCTIDADCADEYVIDKAAALGGDAQAIFDYVSGMTTDPYIGSLRGARGTLWGEAGNSVDKANLLIAMLRYSGIPARYRHGRLDTAQAEQLIGSIFPGAEHMIGYIPADKPVADPAGDATLQEVVQDHWWVEAYVPGVGWQEMDPTFPGASIGQRPAGTLAADGTDQIAELPDDVRHKVRFRLRVEKYNLLYLGGGSGLATEYPLDVTINTVELVGEPINIGHEVNTNSNVGAIFFVVEHTYVPYLNIGSRVAIGNPIQDIRSNFPFGNFVTTGEWIEMTLQYPNGAEETHERVVFDNLGYEQRAAGGEFTLQYEGGDNLAPSVDQESTHTILLAPSAVSLNAIERDYDEILAAIQDGRAAQADMSAAYDADLPEPQLARYREQVDEITQRITRVSQRTHLYTFAALSDFSTQRIGRGFLVKPFYDSPRILINSWEKRGEANDGYDIRFDLLRNEVQTIAYPGQSADGLFGFNNTRGVVEAALETKLLDEAVGAENTISVHAVFRAAEAQNVPLRTLTFADRDALPGMNLSAEAKARIDKVLQTGYQNVVVPEEMVNVAGQTTIGWYEINTVTGETVDTMENGYHQALVSYGGFTAKIVGGEDAHGGIFAFLGYFQGAAGFGLSFIAHLLPKLPPSMNSDGSGGGLKDIWAEAMEEARQQMKDIANQIADLTGIIQKCAASDWTKKHLGWANAYVKGIFIGAAAELVMYDVPGWQQCAQKIRTTGPKYVDGVPGTGGGYEMLKGLIKENIELDNDPENDTQIEKCLRGIAQSNGGAGWAGVTEKTTCKFGISGGGMINGIAMGYAFVGSQVDPPVPEGLFGRLPGVPREPVRTIATVNPATMLNGTAVDGSLTAAELFLDGQITADWTTTAQHPLVFDTLNTTAELYDDTNTLLYTGPLTLTAVPGASSVAGTLNGTDAINMQLTAVGTSAGYAGAVVGLGQGGEWAGYTLTLDSAQTYAVDAATTVATTAAGTTYTGTLRIQTADPAVLNGDGRFPTANFAAVQNATLTTTDLRFGTAAGTVTFDGQPLSIGNGLALTGYDGPLTVSEASPTVDTVQLNGTAGLFTLDLSSATSTTTADNPVVFDAQIAATDNTPFDLIVTAPTLWNITVDGSGRITAVPPLGLAPGDYRIMVTARHTARPAHFVDAIHTVTVQASSGLTVDVNEDPQFTVPIGVPAAPLLSTISPFNNGQVQLTGAAYTIDLLNRSSAAHTVDLQLSGLPTGWGRLSGSDPATPDQLTVTLPPGGPGQIGLYISPTLPLPNAGNVFPFTVQGSSQQGGLTDTGNGVFTVPAISYNQVALTSEALFAAPGDTVTTTMFMRNVGNVSGSFPTTLTVPADFTAVSGLNSSYTADPLQTVSETFAIQAPNPATYGTQHQFAVQTAAPDTIYEPTAYGFIQIVSPNAAPIYDAGEKIVELFPDQIGLIGTIGLIAPSVDRLDTSCQAGIPDPAMQARLVSGLNALAFDLERLFDLVTVVAPMETLAQTIDGQPVADACAETGNVRDVIEQMIDELIDIANHNVDAYLTPGTAVSLNNAPYTYDLRLTNHGRLPTTAAVNLPATTAVTPDWTTQNISLLPDQTITVPLTLTPTQLGTFPIDINVSAVEAPFISRQIPGALTSVDALLEVGGLILSPDYVEYDAGTVVGVQADIGNVTHEPITGEATLTVWDETPTAVLTTTQTITVTDGTLLPVRTGIVALDTTGLMTGTYSLTLHITDGSGQIIPDGTATGSLSVGQAVQATTAVNPQTVSPGNPTVTSEVEVALSPDLQNALTDADGLKTDPLRIADRRDPNLPIVGLPTLIPQAPAASFLVTATLTETVAGNTLPLIITAQDITGAVDTAYTGTIVINTTDGAATVPGPVTFAAADNGQTTVNLTFATAGNHTITVEDADNNGISGSAAVNVLADSFDAGSAQVVLTGNPPADGGSAATVEVDVTDRYGNPLPGVAVWLRVDGRPLSIAANPGVTAADGTHTTQFTATEPGRRAIRVLLSHNGNTAWLDAIPSVEFTGATVSGVMFADANRDGTAQAGEDRLGSVQVTLYPAGQSEPLKAAVTAADGTYTFTNLTAGDYRIEAARISQYAFSTAQALTVTVPALGSVTGQDFGTYAVAQANGRVWRDDDQDGRIDVGEPALPGTTVTAYDSANQQIDTTTTAADGTYQIPLAAALPTAPDNFVFDGQDLTIEEPASATFINGRFDLPAEPLPTATYPQNYDFSAVGLGGWTVANNTQVTLTNDIHSLDGQYMRIGRYDRWAQTAEFTVPADAHTVQFDHFNWTDRNAAENVYLYVYAVTDSGTTELGRVVGNELNEWRTGRINLQAFRGQQIRLRFRTEWWDSARNGKARLDNIRLQREMPGWDVSNPSHVFYADNAYNLDGGHLMINRYDRQATSAPVTIPSNAQALRFDHLNWTSRNANENVYLYVYALTGADFSNVTELGRVAGSSAAGWRSAGMDITAYQGQTVRFRFRTEWWDSARNGRARLDNLRLSVQVPGWEPSHINHVSVGEPVPIAPGTLMPENPQFDLGLQTLSAAPLNNTFDDGRVPLPTGNYPLNYDFSSALTGWTVSNATHVTVQDDVYSLDGPYLQIGRYDRWAHSSPFTVPADAETVTFDYFTWADRNPSENVEMRIYAQSGPDFGAEVQIGSVNSSFVSDWRTATFDIQQYRGQSIRLRFRTEWWDGAANAKARIDNIGLNREVADWQVSDGRYVQVVSDTYSLDGPYLRINRHSQIVDSAPFMVPTNTQAVTFDYYNWTTRDAAENVEMRVYALAGPEFTESTQIGSVSGSNLAGWRSARFDLAAYQGQPIRLRFRTEWWDGAANARARIDNVQLALSTPGWRPSNAAHVYITDTDPSQGVTLTTPTNTDFTIPIETLPAVGPANADFSLMDSDQPAGQYPPNYDFEAGLADWDVSDPTYVTVTADGHSIDGQYLRIGRHSQIVTSAPFTVTAETDTLTFDYQNWTDRNGAEAVELRAYAVFGPEFTAVQELGRFSSSALNGWRTGTVDLQAYQGQQIRIRFRTEWWDGAANAKARLDNMTLRANAPHWTVSNAVYGQVISDSHNIDGPHLRLNRHSQWALSEPFAVPENGGELTFDAMNWTTRDSNENVEMAVYVFSGADFGSVVELGRVSGSYNRGWQATDMDISRYAGETIRVRFRTEWWDGAANARARIDNVRVKSAVSGWEATSERYVDVIGTVPPTATATTVPNADFSAGLTTLASPPANADFNSGDTLLPTADYPTNYDFGTGTLSGWTPSDPTYVSVVSNTSNLDGAHLWINRYGQTATSDSFTVPMDAQALTFDHYNWTTRNADENVRLYVYALSGPNYGTVHELGYANGTNNQQWRTRTFDIQQYRGQSIRLRFRTEWWDGGRNGRARIDNIRLRTTAPQWDISNGSAVRVVSDTNNIDGAHLYMGYSQIATTAPVAVPAETQSLRFRYYNWTNRNADENAQMRIYALSGPNQNYVTEIGRFNGTDNQGWRTAVIDIRQFAGQTVRFRFRTEWWDGGRNAQSRLDNVSFAAELPQWEVSNSLYVRAENSNAISGTYALLNRYGQYITSQPFTVPADVENLTFDYWNWTNRNLSENVQLRVFAYSGDDFSVSTELGRFNGNNTEGWKDAALDLSAFRTQTIRLRFRVEWWDGGRNGRSRIDNIALTTTATPAPAVDHQPPDGDYLRLNRGGTYVTSDAFRLPANADAVQFDHLLWTTRNANENVNMRVYILSGENFGISTQIRDVAGRYNQGWRQSTADLSAFAGQIVKLRFRTGWWDGGRNDRAKLDRVTILTSGTATGTVDLTNPGDNYLRLNRYGAYADSTAFMAPPDADQLTFDYWPWTTRNANENAYLRVYVLSGDNFSTQTQLAQLAGDYNGGWRSAALDLSAFADQPIKLRFRTLWTDGGRNDRAKIDNIDITRTGVDAPPVDNTADGNFLLLNRYGAWAISNPLAVPTTTQSLHFNYQIWTSRNSAETAYMRVYALSGPDFGTETQLTQLSGRAQDGWQTADLNLSAYAGQTIRLRFRTLWTNSGRNDRARIDNVYLLPVSETDYTIVETNPVNFTSTTSDSVPVSVYGGDAPTVNFGDISVDRYQSTIDVTPQILPADGQTTAAITVTVRDGLGQPLPNYDVALSAGGTGLTLSQPTAPTNAAGQTFGSLQAVDAPQTVYVTARTLNDNVTLADPVPVTVTVGAADADNSTLTAAPAVLVADPAHAADYTVTLRDTFNNPAPSRTVTMTIDSLYPVTVTQTAVQTDLDGRVDGQIISERPQTITVTAVDTTDGITVTQTADIHFTTTDADQSTLDVTPTSVPADGNSAADITATLRDPFGTAVPNQAVTLTADAAQPVSLTQAALTSDAAGQITAQLRSATAQTVTLTAVDTTDNITLSATPVVTFTTTDPDQSTVTVAPSTLIAHGVQTATVTVMLRAQNSLPLPDKPVELAISGSENYINGLPSPTAPDTLPAGTTAADGTVTAVITSTQPGVKTISAVGDGIPLNNTATVTFTTGPADTANSTLTTSANQVIANGTDTATLTATLLDGYGHPIAGEAITITAGGTNVTLNQPTVTTDAAGQTQATIRSTTVQTVSVSAAVLTDTVTVRFVPGPMDAGQTTVVMTPTTAVADGVDTVTVTAVLRDVLGHELPGRTVQLTATGPGTGIQPGAVTTTDASGAVTYTVTSTEVDNKTITLTDLDSAVSLTVGQAEFVAGAIDVVASTVTADRTTITADGLDAATLTATLLDGSGHPIPNEQVVFTSTAAVTITAPLTQTNGNGQLAVTVAADQPQTAVVTAIAPTAGITLTPPVTLTFIAGALSPTQSTAVVAPTTIVADGVGSAVISATLRDDLGRPLAHRSIDLTVSGSSNTITPTAPTSADLNGRVAFTLTTTTAELKTLTLRDTVSGNTMPVGVVTATAGVPDADASTVSVSASTAPADGSTPITVTVRLRDANGNPVPGRTAVLTTTAASGVTVNQPTAPSDANGELTATITGTSYDPVTIFAAVDGLTLVDRPTVTFIGPDIYPVLSGAGTGTVGRPYTYTVSVNNTGLIPAADTVLDIALPNVVTFITHTAGIEAVSTADGLAWSIGDLAAGDNRSFQLVVNIDPTAPLNSRPSATLTANTTTPELDTADNDNAHTFRVLPGYAYTFNLAPAEATVPIGGAGEYALTVRNQGNLADVYTLDVNSMPAALYTLTPTVMALGPGEIGQATLTVGSNQCTDAGAYSFFATATAANKGNTSTRSGDLTLTTNPLITNLAPADGARSGSNDLLFTWRTAVSGTSSIFIRPVGGGSYTEYTGDPGTRHRVSVPGLSRNISYEWYARTTSICGTADSGVRTIEVLNGVTFTPRTYNFTVQRDYDQRRTLQVTNQDTISHTVMVSLTHTYDDLIINFIGDGSVDAPITLQPGESRQIDLGIHTQDAVEEVYALTARLVADDESGIPIEDAVPVNINIDTPNYDFTVEMINSDPQTLVKTYRITNNGDPLTDLSVTARTGPADSGNRPAGVSAVTAVSDTNGVYLHPGMSHGYLRTGDTFIFEAMPVGGTSFEDIDGLIEVSAGTVVTSAPVSMTLPSGYSMYLGEAGDVTMEAQASDWYCTNRPVINNKIVLPAGFRRSDVNSAELIMTFQPRSNVRPHDIDLSINDNMVGQLTNLIPQGMYRFDIDPGFLNESQFEPSVNYINLRTRHMNGGHYVVASDMIVSVCLDSYREWVAADSQAAADAIVAGRSFLIPPATTLDTEVLAPAPTTDVYTGQPVQIRVRLNDDVSETLFYNVTASADNGNGALILYDDGQHGDGGYRDGVYAGTWTPVNPGTTTITINAGSCSIAGDAQVTVEVQDASFNVSTDQRVLRADAAVDLGTAAPVPTAVVTTTDTVDLNWLTTLDGSRLSATQRVDVTLNDMRPGEVRRVTAGTVVSYTGPGGQGRINLPATYATAGRLVALTPDMHTVSRGSGATYQAELYNPGPTNQMTISVGGVPQVWTADPQTVNVPVGERRTIDIPVRVPVDAPLEMYALSVRAETAVGGDAATADLQVVDWLDLSVEPFIRFAPAGEYVTYTVALTNTEGTGSRTYNLAHAGLTHSQVTMPAAISAAAGQTVSFTVGITAYENSGYMPVVVTATADNDSRISRSGRAYLHMPHDERVRATLLPPTAVGGPGSVLTYTLSVMNMGEQPDDYEMSVQVPAGWQYELTANGQPVNAVSLTPYTFNEAFFTLRVTAAPTAVPADGPFPVAVTVQSVNHPGVQAEAAAVAQLIDQGVDVAITPQTTTMAPTDSGTWTVQVTNHGTAPDTFGLEIGGYLAGVASLSADTVSLSPGQSANVTLSAPAMPHAVRQTVPFYVRAQSLFDTRAQAVDEATITFTDHRDVQVEIRPPIQTLTNTMVTTYTIWLTNTGNVNAFYDLSTIAPGLSQHSSAERVFIPPHMNRVVNLTLRATMSGTYPFNSTGTDTIAAVTDDDSAVLVIDAEALQHAPVAFRDLAITPEDTALVLPVLDNDTDANGDPLTVTAVGGPLTGTAEIAVGTTITYTPAADFYGTDVFTYTVGDGTGRYDTDMITVTVTPINDAPRPVDDVDSLPEDGAASTAVLSNDTDVDGPTMSLTAVGAPISGTAAISGTRVVYTPTADYNGVDAVTYTVSDGIAAPVTATVRYTVTAVNDIPQPADDVAGTPENTPVMIPVLDNDIDIDGDVLTVTAVSAPISGTAVISPDGTLFYTPSAELYGTDIFTYTVDDGAGGVATATVRVNVAFVNAMPLTVDDASTLPEDGNAVVDVLGNDSDPEGTTLNIVGLAGPTNGTAVVNADRTLAYTPTADYFGTDEIVYTVRDFHGGEVTATLALTVTAVNDMPVAMTDTVAFTNTLITVTVPVLANDYDVDGDALTVTGVSIADGTAHINPDNTVTVTPTWGGAPTIVLTYDVADTQSAVDTGVVVIEQVSPTTVVVSRTTAEADMPTAWLVWAMLLLMTMTAGVWLRRRRFRQYG